MKTSFKIVGMLTALILFISAEYVAPTFADAGISGVSKLINPNAPAEIHTGPFTAEQARQWNEEISIAWNSPLNNKENVIRKGGTFKASNPFGIDTSPFMFDIKTLRIIGMNPGYLQPMGYGDTCVKPTFFTTPKVIPTATVCDADEAARVCD